MFTLESADAGRMRRLDSRLLVWMVVTAATALFVLGLLRAPYPYADPRFAVALFDTEVQVTLLLAVATALWFPGRRMGLRAPRLAPPRAAAIRRVAPLVLLLLAAAGAWAVARLSLPAGAAFDDGLSWRVLRTTALVGVNEEWLFRGLLLAAFCRWWGLRRGAIAASLAFGAFHVINVLAGQPPAMVAVQVLVTLLMGAIFLMAALGTRSLLLPMVGHALYDFAVIDIGRLAAAGANATGMLVVTVLGLALGIWCLIEIGRLRGAEPYPT
jgi:membrane protease YdiL (CAAX protease family)